MSRNIDFTQISNKAVIYARVSDPKQEKSGGACKLGQ
ncbi:putative site-specific integrase-resolvase [Elusimicrobium simillimum]